MTSSIRPLTADDYGQWLALWDGNNLGQRDEAVTAHTWRRLTDPDSQVHGLCAEHNGKLTGLVHYILHPTTGSVAPVCYMQDVFVDPAHRQKGIARALVNEVAHIGRRAGWARMYWLAEADNLAAQKLYKSLGVKLDFTLHVLPLQKV
jgi:GNAT superfamily N-acetyltransferase